METIQVIKKHEKIIRKVRLFVKLLLLIIAAAIIYLQHQNLYSFFKWLFN